MKYRDNMTKEEVAVFMAEIDAFDKAMAEADAFHDRQYRLWLEWVNMTEGGFIVEALEREDDLRRAALDHRGMP